MAGALLSIIETQIHVQLIAHGKDVYLEVVDRHGVQYSERLDNLNQTAAKLVAEGATSTGPKTTTKRRGPKGGEN